MSTPLDTARAAFLGALHAEGKRLTTLAMLHVAEALATCFSDDPAARFESARHMVDAASLMGDPDLGGIKIRPMGLGLWKVTGP